MRSLIINFARANSDIFVRAFKDKREFDHWLEIKSSLRPRPGDLKSHWGDHHCLRAASALLKTPICCFAPVRTLKPFWVSIDGIAHLHSGLRYPQGFTYPRSGLKVILDNRGEHFVPTGLSRLAWCFYCKFQRLVIWVSILQLSNMVQHFL